ncbi:MAG: ABC transporter substrate-binding protein [Deltaproteobacteria bacterium]|nr:ABC transporter substrate-binding protein [Deltaproteobacteria bacterium]
MVPEGSTVLVLVLCLLAASCGGRPTAARDAVVVLLPREPDTLDPRMCGDPACVKITRLIYRSLVTVDPRSADLVLDLASSITEVGPLRYDVELRPGVRFHSGAQLEAADVAATLRSIADPRLVSPYQRPYARYRVEVTGRRTLTIRLTEPHATVMGDLELPILPARLARPRPLVGAEADGTGPFRLVDRRPGRMDLALVSPRGLRVAMRLIKDDNTRALRLQGGGGDLVVNGLSPELYPIFDGRSGFRVVSAPGSSFTYLGFNLEDRVLGDVRVRRAIAHAIDRRSLVDGKFGGHARLATAMIAPGHWSHAPEVRGPVYDPARARALLREAGHGRLELVLASTTARFRVGIARAMAWMLGLVGISVTVRPMEMGTLKADLAAGRVQMFGLQIPEVLEPNVYDRFFHSASIPDADSPDRGANRFRYASARADRLIELGRSTTDRSVRKEAYRELQELLSEDLPCVPLWHEDNVSIVSRRVRGYFPSVTGRFEALASVSLGR